MPNQIHIDRRVLYSFMLMMTVMNAVIFFIPWKEIMAGKNDFPLFYSNAQMVREGQARASMISKSRIALFVALAT